MKISSHIMRLNPNLTLVIELDVGTNEALPDDANCIFISPGFPTPDFPNNDTMSNVDILMPKEYGAYDRMVEIWEDLTLRKVQTGAMSEILNDCMMSIVTNYEMYDYFPHHSASQSGEIRFNPEPRPDLWSIRTQWLTVTVLPKSEEAVRDITLVLGNYVGPMNDLAIAKSIAKILGYGTSEMQKYSWGL